MLVIPDDLAIHRSVVATGLWEIYPRIGQQAQRLLTAELTAAQYLRLLVEHHQLSDALRFVAHALDRRQAVYWGCLCWGSFFGPRQLPVEQEQALEAAMRWVREPIEANRRLAGEAGQRATMSTAAGCLAMAAFWSGGSLSREGLPLVAPRPHMLPRAVAGAVILTAAKGEYHRLDDNKQLLLRLAMDVDQGIQRWVEPAATSVDHLATTVVGAHETLVDPLPKIVRGGERVGAAQAAPGTIGVGCLVP